MPTLIETASALSVNFSTSSAITFSSTPEAGDVVIVVSTKVDSTPSGLGATWSKEFDGSLIDVWIAEDASAAGTVTLTGVSNYRSTVGYLVRGLASAQLDYVTGSAAILAGQSNFVFSARYGTNNGAAILTPATGWAAILNGTHFSTERSSFTSIIPSHYTSYSVAWTQLSEAYTFRIGGVSTDAALRVDSVSAPVLVTGDPDLRVSGVRAEVLTSGDPDLRVSGVRVEALVGPPVGAYLREAKSASGGSSTSGTLALVTTPAPTDTIVFVFSNAATGARNISCSGLGATWEVLTAYSQANANLAYVIGRGATAAGNISWTISGGAVTASSLIAYLVGGTGGDVLAMDKTLANVSNATGPSQAVDANVFVCAAINANTGSTTWPNVNSLPSSDVWTRRMNAPRDAAYAIPNTAGTYRTNANHTGTPSVAIAQLVLGTSPAPAGTISLGDAPIVDLRLGDAAVLAAYVGAEQVFG